MSKVSKFLKSDEKEFLLGYLEFTSRIRITMLKHLDEKLKRSKSLPERQCHYILALEQLLLLYESYQGFYIAFRDSNYQKPFLDSLASDNRSVQSIFEKLMSKSDKEIIRDLNYKNEDLNEAQTKLVEERLVSIAKMWSNQRFVKFMKEMFLPLLNKLKHKLMVYARGKEIMIVFEDQKQKAIENLMKEEGISPDVNIKSLDEVLDIALRLNRAIQDIIVLRLYKLGTTLSELPVLHDDFIS